MTVMKKLTGRSVTQLRTRPNQIPNRANRKLSTIIFFSVCANYLAADAGIVSKTKISNEPTICAVMLIVSASMIKKMIEINLLKR